MGRQVYCTQACRERTKKRRQRQTQRVERAMESDAVRRASKSDLKAVAKVAAKEAAQEVARETERAFVKQDAQLWTLLEEYREANDRLYANLTDLKKEATARMQGLQSEAMLLAVLLQHARAGRNVRITDEQNAVVKKYLDMAKHQMGAK